MLVLFKFATIPEKTIQNRDFFLQYKNSTKTIVDRHLELPNTNYLANKSILLLPMPADNRQYSLPSRVTLRYRSPPPYPSVSQSSPALSDSLLAIVNSLMIPTNYGLSTVNSSPPTLPIFVPPVIGVAPDKVDQRSLCVLQRDVPNLTTFCAPGRVEQIA